MNVTFILMLSLILQLLFGFLLKLLFPGVSSIPWVYYIEVTMMGIVSIFLPAYLYQKDEKREYFTDCFKDVKADVLILICVCIGFCCQYIGILISAPLKYLVSLSGYKHVISLPGITGFKTFIIAIVALCVVPAVFEEVMFRGIVFNYFRQFGKKAAVIISALLFAIMHLDFFNFPATFMLGIVCGYIICKTNRIFYTMIVHFSFNFISVLSDYIRNFDLINTFYADILPVFFVICIPLLIYLINILKNKAVYHSYKDQMVYEAVVENIIPINEESSIKIIEHDIRENNLKMAFGRLVKSPWFYVIMILYIVVGGSDLWK